MQTAIICRYPNSDSAMWCTAMQSIILEILTTKKISMQESCAHFMLMEVNFLCFP